MWDEWSTPLGCPSRSGAIRVGSERERQDGRLARAREAGTPAQRPAPAQAVSSAAIASKTWTYWSTEASSCVTERVHSSSRPGVMNTPRFML
jgi:hypothetical protein